jgi:hypothetical protein
MTFTVFPDATSGPLSLGPGEISDPFTFPETAGDIPPAVVLRIVMLGDGCEPPDAPHPTFQLRAGEGVPVDLPDDQRTVFVRDRPEAVTDPVASARLFIEGEHVYAIKILIRRPGSTWQLRITNHDEAERKFTWVVADNEPESAQPWLNLPQTLQFNGTLSQDITQSLDVRNLGTGPLTISLGGLPASSQFQIEQVPTDIAPNHCGRLIITFHAPSSAGSIEELYTAESNDQHAADSAHHNNLIRLLARTAPPAVPDKPVDRFPSDDASFGACRENDGCRSFKPPAGSLASHPIFGRRCRRVGCGHDISRHRPPI